MNNDFFICDTGASDWFVRPVNCIDYLYSVGTTEVDKAGGAVDTHLRNNLGEILMDPRATQLLPLGLCAANNILSFVWIQGQAGPYIGFLEPWEATAILAILAPKYLQEPTVNNLPHYDPFRAELARTVYSAIVANHYGESCESAGQMLKPRPRMRERVDEAADPAEVIGPVPELAPFREGGA